MSQKIVKFSLLAATAAAQKHWASWMSNMKDGFPRPTEKQIVAVFQEYIDQDQNGLVTDQEILTFTSQLLERERREEAATEMEQWDITADGQLGLGEMLEGLSLNEIDPEVEKDPTMKKFFEEDQVGSVSKFEAADKDNNGHLSPTELINFLYPELDQATLKAEVEHQLRTKDRNSDGRISLAEFREVEVDDQDVSHDIYNAELSEFRLYDRDLNMHLDREELEGMISGMTYAVDRIRDFMYIVDANQDSKIDMGELRLAYDRIALHDTISEIFWYKQEIAEEVFEKGKASAKEGAAHQEL